MRTKWFFSYLLILVIPILLSLGIYSYSMNITRTQTNRVNDALTEQLKLEMDGRITEIFKLFDQFSLDNSVQILTNRKGSFNANDQLEIYKVSQELQSYKISYDFIEDVFFYFNNTGTALSLNGHMSGELLYHLYFENGQYNLLQFQELMARKHMRDIYRIHKTNGQNVLLFLQTTMRTGTGDSSGTIAVCMDESRLRAMLGSIKWDSQSIICIMDGKNSVISTTSPFQAGEPFLSSGSGGLSYRTIGGMNYVVSQAQSSVVDWKYIILTPDFIFEKNARHIQFFTVIGLFFCIFLGMGAAYALTKRNYNPLAGIMELFRKHGKAPERPMDEFRWLREAAENFFKTQEDNEKTLWMDRRLLKNYYLFKLLEERYDEKNFRDYFEKNDVPLHGTHHQVVLFFLKDSENPSPVTEDDYQNLKLFQFIVTNMFEEQAGNHFNVAMTDVGGQAAAIVSFSEAGADARNILEGDIDFVQQKAQEYFSLEIVAAVGGTQKGMEGIHESCLEAREASEYISLLSGQEIIFYDDVKNTQRKYFYPMESEQKIVNAMEAGDEKSANGFIARVFEENFFAGNTSVEMERCMLYDMLGTIIRGAELGGCPQLLEKFDLSREIAASKSVQAVCTRMKEAVGTICRYVAQKRESQSNNRQLSGDIVAFIQANYKNPDLNISLTGQHFNMTPAYLSGLFKKQVGKNLLEYINTVRIDAAKELLRKGYSVVEVSGMVGFRDSGSMIRVFKKITGVTPGQMKKSL